MIELFAFMVLSGTFTLMAMMVLVGVAIITDTYTDSLDRLVNTTYFVGVPLVAVGFLGTIILSAW